MPSEERGATKHASPPSGQARRRSCGNSQVPGQRERRKHPSKKRAALHRPCRGSGIMPNVTSGLSLRVAISKCLGATLACVSLGVLNAEAQEALSAEGPIDSVTVTGTRIARDGYDAPTPVSVLGAEEIQTSGTANVADFVNTLPSVVGSATASNSSGALSNGQAGIAALNLRSLGTNRTLVLLDGQRSVASASTGAV